MPIKPKRTRIEKTKTRQGGKMVSRYSALEGRSNRETRCFHRPGVSAGVHDIKTCKDEAGKQTARMRYPQGSLE